MSMKALLAWVALVGFSHVAVSDGVPEDAKGCVLSAINMVGNVGGEQCFNSLDVFLEEGAGDKLFCHGKCKEAADAALRVPADAPASCQLLMAPFSAAIRRGCSDEKVEEEAPAQEAPFWEGHGESGSGDSLLLPSTPSCVPATRLSTKCALLLPFLQGETEHAPSLIPQDDLCSCKGEITREVLVSNFLSTVTVSLLPMLLPLVIFSIDFAEYKKCM
jgi:hypothetical protein